MNQTPHVDPKSVEKLSKQDWAIEIARWLARHDYELKPDAETELLFIVNNALQAERQRGEEREKAYQAGITKIASQLRDAGFKKTADLIIRDLEALKANPTVEALTDNPK